MLTVHGSLFHVINKSRYLIIESLTSAADVRAEVCNIVLPDECAYDRAGIALIGDHLLFIALYLCATTISTFCKHYS